MLDSGDSFSASKAEQFADKLVLTLNNAATALMISVGHRTGLFDAMAELPSSSVAQIAAASAQNERYVKEWLGAMVTAKIVDYDAGRETYRLPKEHAAFLTRPSAPNNLAAMAQYIPLLGAVEDRIVECFRDGGGVSYADFPRFHEVMAEDSGQTVLPALIDSILPLVAGIRQKLQQGIEVLDIGCGSGRAINLMAKTYPNSFFYGYDFSEEGINNARREADALGLKNIRFEVKDAAELDEPNSFDLITAFDAIHDQAKPLAVLKAINRALRPQGIFLMQDMKGSSDVHKNMQHPIAPLLYTISCLHCMTVSLAENGDGLGAMWGEEKALEMLSEAGFAKVEVHHLAHDIQNQYYVASKN
ncbi:MAG TPA: class I SAM-dependent methyltransferase [Pyrinomonadaceae bacterium]|jgi:ubiquinone/menaquinone biosynthesis C-methylase UbiE